MKKLSNINESLWSDIQDRNAGEVIRQEDDPYNFSEDFKKIEQMELICPNSESELNSGFLWTPCNFGSDSFDKPGRYLNSDEIRALNEFLAKTDYRIATHMTFQRLADNRFEYVKIDKIWYYVFENYDGEKIYIPNFGFCSEKDPENVVMPSNKKDLAPYGCPYYKDKMGYITFHYTYNYIICRSYVNSNQTSTSDRFQIRLVKKFNK